MITPMKKTLPYLFFFLIWGALTVVWAQPIDVTTQLTKFLVDLRAGTLGVANPITSITTTGQNLGADQNGTTPTYSFTGETGLGFFRILPANVGLQGSLVVSAAYKTTTGSAMAVANVGANSCGTTTATVTGNNNALVVTVGAGSGTQCRVAFSIAAVTEWSCAANDNTTTVAVRTTPVDTTHTDLIGSFTAADKITAVCFAR